MGKVQQKISSHEPESQKKRSPHQEELRDSSTTLQSELVRRESVEAFPDEPLRSVVYRMAEKQVTRVPVVEPETRIFLGLVALDDLLKARARHLEEEKRRERVLDLRFFLPGGGAQEWTGAQEQTETHAAL